MTAAAPNLDALVPVAKTLLSGSFAFCLVRSMSGNFDLQLSFERLSVGFLALVFYKSGASILSDISSDLTEIVSKLNHRDDLKALVLEAFRKSASENTPSGSAGSVNLPAIVEQAWRTGIWGAMSAIVDWVFLVTEFLLDCARDVFWKLLLFLFPIACGLYPVFPRILSNLSLYALELALWPPVLAIVGFTTGIVARESMSRSGSWGLYVVAVELLAIILILLIPSVTHRFLSGAFSGDFEAQAGLLRAARKAVVFAKSWGTRS